MTVKLVVLDWRAMKIYQIRILLLPVVAFLIGLFIPLLVIPTCVMIFLFFSINPFAVEEKGALNNLYLTLPVERNEIVTGRFLLSLLMALCGVVISIPIMFLADRFSLSHFYLPFDWYVFILALSYLLYAVFNLTMFPLLFRLGYNKGKFWGFYLPVVLLSVIFGTFTSIIKQPGNEKLLIDILEFAHKNMLLVSGGTALAATVLLLISYLLSLRLYSKRDL